MKWVIRLTLVALALGTSRPVSAGEAKPRQPNIVFLLADDLRWNAVGFMGDKLAQTPNLDKLARRGVVFRNAFVTTSICAVSRASVLSGQYARRHKINNFDTAFTAEAFARTYPMLLRRAGYRVGFIGKFGVGTVMPAKSFDYWKGFPGQGSYFAKGETVHLTHRMGDQALEFLEGCDRKRPFCLSISFKCPHAQDRAKREFPPDPEDEKRFADVTFPVPKTANKKFFKLLPESVQKSEGRKRWEYRFATEEKFQQNVRDYYRLVTGMDREIGRIIAALETLGFGENTIIVFMSDNGFFFGERELADKWFMYEESIRVPLLIVDPRANGTRGRQVDAMALNIDIAPTLLDYAGVKAPKEMQGMSLAPFVRGESPAWRKDFFYEHHTLPKIIPPSEGVRTERWAYLRWVGEQPPLEELYDVQNDPREEHNLVGRAEHRATLERLRARWMALRKELE